MWSKVSNSTKIYQGQARAVCGCNGFVGQGNEENKEICQLEEVAFIQCWGQSNVEIDATDLEENLKYRGAQITGVEV